MLHPLMAALAVVGLGAAGGTASQPSCTVEARAAPPAVPVEAEPVEKSERERALELTAADVAPRLLLGVLGRI